MWLRPEVRKQRGTSSQKGEGPEAQGQQSSSERSQRHIVSFYGLRGHRQCSHMPHVDPGAWHVPGPPLQTCPSEPGIEDARWTPHPGPLHRLPGLPGGTELTMEEGQGDTTCSQPQDPGHPLGSTPTGHAAAPAPPSCRTSSSSFTPPLRCQLVTPQVPRGPRGPLTCCTSGAGRSPPGRGAWRCW